MRLPSPSDPGAFEYRFSPTAAAIPTSRRLLAEWLTCAGAPKPVVDDLMLAASELCTNAVRHASGTERSAAIRAWFDDGEAVVLEVEDDGPGFGWSSPLPEPALDGQSGRGLFIVQEVTDDVRVLGDTAHTIVRCRKHLP